jgi:pyruvate dehydrogenase E2 component (dihydrolipoamide acetyltransferase)
VTPVAQRLAQEHGIDLARVNGSGPGGRISREDVQAIIDRGSAAPNRNGSKVLAAPAVRKLARDNGIDLATIGGTGFDGHITRADVEAILNAPTAQTAPTPQPVAPPAPAPVPQPVAPAPIPAPVAAASAPYSGERTEIPLSRMRQTIARQLVRSAQEAPHVYVQAQLDLTDALRALPEGVGVNALLLYLTVQTLKDIPDLNATYEDGHLYHYPRVNLAVAVALPDGLITPTLHGADDFSLTGLASRSKDLISRARSNRLKPDEMSGGTFTVSNLGIVEQIERFTAILNPPQVGILAVGAAKERPLVINGGIHVRTTAYFSLSVDHRIIDGLGAARFIEAYDKNLQAFKG